MLNLAELVMPPAADAANSLTQAWWMDDAELAALVSPPSRPARHRRAAGRRLRQRPRRPHFGPRQDLQPVTVLADATWRQHGLWAIDTFNPNAWASAKDVMLHSPADILALQEVRVHDEEQCRRLEQAARPCGWTASIAPASRTAAGSSSAGVAILARRGIGMADHGAESLPCTHRDRLSVNWIGGVRRGGMHVISIYLWTSEGLSERNSSLLHHLSLLIGSLRGPWIVAGDWNVEPTVLQQAGWPAKLRGQLFAPTLPTCGLRCYDFFLVDVAIAHMVVGVQAISDAGGRPHRVSRLLLDGALQRGQVRQMVKPRAIIADLPPTAPRRPPDLSAVLATRPQADSLDAGFAAWYTAAEQEFTHLRGPAATPGDGFCGRASPVRFRWVSAASVHSSPHVGATALSLAWRAVASWCLPLGQPQPSTTDGSRRRSTTIGMALTALRNAVARKLPEGQDAMDFRAFLLDLTPAVIATQGCMLHAYRSASKIAKRLELARMSTARANWRRSLCHGARLTKAAFRSVKAPCRL